VRGKTQAENTILLLTPSKEALVREATLRKGGFKVISVMSPVQVRFEIEMGRCGTLLICHRLSETDASEMARLFRRYCPEGRIVFVTDVPKPERAPLTQILQYRSLVDRKDRPSIKRIPTVGKRRLIEKTCALIRPFSIQPPNFEVLEN
jgi:hypothetical protein